MGFFYWRIETTILRTIDESVYWFLFCCCCNVLLPHTDILVNLLKVSQPMAPATWESVWIHSNSGENSHFNYHNTHGFLYYPYDGMTVNRLLFQCTYSECEICELLDWITCGIKSCSSAIFYHHIKLLNHWDTKDTQKY